MPKIPDCHRCQYFANSPYMVCGIHPCGPTEGTCEDFSALAQPFHWKIAEADPPKRQPIGGGYYAGDWIPQPFPTLTADEQLALLDWHPQFSGRCPNCEMPIAESANGRWKCEHCEWEASEAISAD